jgi:hypothetical protein
VLWPMHSAKHVPRFLGWATLPSAMALASAAHDKVTKNSLFFCFFAFQSNKQ